MGRVVVWAIVLLAALASPAPAADCNGNGVDDAIEVSPLAFEVVPIPVAFTTPGRVVARDLDGDGDVDLAVTETLANTVAVLKNDGAGAFAAPVRYATGVQPFALAAGGIGGAVITLGASDVDLFVANFGGGSITWLHNDGSGVFNVTPATTLPVGPGTQPSDVVLADFNADDAADLVTANSALGVNTLTAIPGDGLGGFLAAASGPTAAGPRGLAVADADGNGTPDLLIASRMAGQLTFRPNEGATEQILSPIPEAFAVAAGDVDGDGDPDAVVASFTGNQIVVVGNGGASGWAQIDTVPVSQPTSVVLVDLDGDGYRDVATVSYPDGVVVVARNRGDGRFETPIPISVGAGPIDVVAADVDGDGRRDLIVTSNAAGTVSVLRQRALPTTADCDADGVPDACELAGHDCNANAVPDVCDIAPPRTFAPHADTTFTNAHVRVAVGDVDGDGRADVVRTVGGALDQVEVHLAAADGTLAPGPTFLVGDGPQGVVVADLDGDGDRDIAVATAADVTVLRLSAGGTSASTASVNVGDGPTGLVAIDIDGDGDLDLVSANHGTPALGVARNAGGTFTADAPIALAHAEPLVMVTGDVDGDGDADLIGLGAAVAGTETRWYRSAGGTLVDEGVIAAPPANTLRLGIAAADLDGDGDPDLAALDFSIVSGNAQVDVYRNEGGAFAPAGRLPVPINAGSGAAGLLLGGVVLRDGRALVLATDLDGDGAPDLAVIDADAGGVRVFFNDGTGAFGPGRRLAGRTTPQGLLAGDLDGDGGTDVVGVTTTRALGVFRSNVRRTAPDCTGDGVPDVCNAGYTDCNTNGVPDTCEPAAADADGDGVPDCVERDAACANCRDDDGDGALDLADSACASAPFATVRATAAAPRGRKPGKVAIVASIGAALPDLSAGAPELTLSLGSKTVYCGRPSLRKRRKTYRLTAPDGALRSLVVAVNARRSKSKLRALFTDPGIAPVAGAPVAVSLQAGGQALHTAGTWRAHGRRFVGP